MTDERDENVDDEPREPSDVADEAAAAEEATAQASDDAPSGEATAQAGDDAPAAEDGPEAAAEGESEDAGAPDADEEKKAAAPRRRRGSAETSAARKAPAPRRDRDGHVVVRARAKYVRTAPRKARLVVDHIRGKPVEEARAILRHTTRAAAQDVLKVLNSAVANAEHNHELDAEELVVQQAFVDEGPTLKRYRPRAQGRATRIRKRTSHLTIAVATKQ